MSFKEEIVVTNNETLPPQEQLELARIQAEIEAFKSKTSLQRRISTMVSLIIITIFLGSIYLTDIGKEVPAFFPTTATMAIGGILTSIGFTSGAESERRKK